MKRIVLAGGCFWGVEAYFSRLKGVVKTNVGYVNGHTKNPTYEEVCNFDTGYAEACYVTYDDDFISLEKLLSHFWRIIDPTVKNRQGPDFGSQYRTGIYYVEEDDLPVIQKSKDHEQNNHTKKIVTEIEPLKNYYEAEEYHQKYLEKNPKGYCHIDLSILDNE